MPLNLNVTGTELNDTTVSPQTGLDLTAGKQKVFRTPARGTSYTSLDPTKYSKFFDKNVHAEFDTDYLDPIRAARQSGAAQLGAGLLQSGTEIVGGAIEGIGYLGDVKQTINAIKGIEQEWGNRLSDIGIAMKTWSREAAPIYVDPDSQGKFRPGEWSWWMSNAPSIASTLSLMIPATGVVKGVSMAGKMAGLSAKMGKTTSFLTTAVGQAVTSRLMENGMEASQSFEQTYKELINMGVPDEVARKQAGIQASDLWNKEWVMLAQDIPQYALLGAGLNKASSALTIPSARKLGLSKAVMGKIALNNGKYLLADGLSEGGEEVFQYILADRATHLARAALDNEYDYKPSMKEYLREGELWSSFTLGALGSTVFQTAGRKLNKVIQGNKDPRVENIASWAPEIKVYREALQEAKLQGNDKASSDAASDLAVALSSKASSMGNAQALIDVVEDVYDKSLSDEQAQSIGLTPQDQEFIRSEYPTIIENIKETVSAYETYAKKYDNDISARLAGNDVRRKRARNKLVQYEANREELKKEIIGFDSLSIAGQQYELGKAAGRSKQKIKAAYEERLKKDSELSTEERKELTKRIETLDKSITRIKGEIDNINKTRTPEEKESDKNINITSAALDNYFENEDRINEVNEQISVYDNADKHFRETQTKRKKGKKTSKYKKPDLSSDKQSERDIIDQDVVNNVDELSNQAEAITASQVTDDIESDYIMQNAYDRAVNDGVINKVEQDIDAQKAENNESTIDTPSNPNKSKTIDELAQEDLSVERERIDIDDEGNVIGTSTEKKPTHSEPVKKDESSSIIKDSEDESVAEDNGDFDSFTDDNTFMNLSTPIDKKTEAYRYLNNPKSKLKTREIVFTLDLGDYFIERFGIEEAGKILARIEEGDITLLETEDGYNSIVDKLPIKAVIRSKKNKKTVDGDFFVFESNTAPKKEGMDIRTKNQISKVTRSFRQKILEGILLGKEVTTDNLKRSPGEPNLTPSDNNLGSALNINPANIKIGISKPGGVIIDSSGNRLPGRSDSYGGNVFAIVNSTVNGTAQPIKLNVSKVSKEHADLIFEAFNQVVAAKGTYAVEFVDPLNRTSKMTAGQLLNMLVYNGYNNTSQVKGSIRYRKELIPKQLFINNNTILHYGENILNLKNYTPQQKQHFIDHVTKYMNYRINIDAVDAKIQSPLRIDNIEVTETDIKAGITYKELYINNNHITTTSKVDENGSTHEDSHLYIEYSDIDSISYDDKPATESVEKPVDEKKTKSTDEDLHNLLDEEMGITNTRLFKDDYNYIQSNIEEEVSWIKEKLGDNVPVEVVDDFIKVVTNTGSNLAYGTFKNNAITLYDKAEKGTGYHEAFHGVFRMYLSYEEREKILNEASKRYGVSFDKLQLEEKLAEDFRKYVLTEKKASPEPGILKRFFSKLYNFIKDIFISPTTKVQDLDINGLFSRIENGYFKKSEIKPDSLSRYTNYEVLHEVEGFSGAQVESITKQLLYQVVRTNDIVELDDISKITYAPVKEWIDNLLNRLESSLGNNEKNDKVYNIFKRVNDNFDTFESLLDDMLMSMNIRKIQEFDEDYTTNEFDKHIKESYEYSSRGNMLDNIKLFIATIPSDERDSFTEMVTIVDFDKAWKKIMRDLHNATNPDEMISRLKDKARTSLFYKTLLNGNNNRPGLATGGENFKTQFFTSIKKHKHNFIKVLSDPTNKKYTFIDAEMVSLSAAIATEWSISFAEDNGLFNETTGTPNATNIRKVIGNYNALSKNYSREYGKSINSQEVPNFDKTINNITTIFDMIGIDLSHDDILDILDKKNSTKSDALKSFIEREMNDIFGDSNSFLSTLINDESKADEDKLKLFISNKSIQTIAGLVAHRNEDNVASSVLGPDGNNYYVYASNNFMTDYITNLSYDKNFVNQLQNSVGKKRSYFLGQLQAGADISLSTFLGYKEGNETVDYFDMEPEQDYLMKASAILDGRLPLPTISDKKFFGYLNGFSKVLFTPNQKQRNKGVVGASINAEGRYQFPEQLYTIFEGYYQDEVDRIEKVKEDILNAEKKDDYRSLIKGYHFNGVTEDNQPILKDPSDGQYTGNGTKLILFKEFENKEFNRENLEKMFKRLVNKEVRAALDHNIIKGNIGGPKTMLRNLKLSKHHFDNNKALFSDENLVVYNMIADITMNSIVTNVEISNLFSMDAAFYDSKKGDIFKDVTKRLAELVAPGQNLRTSFEIDEFNSGVLEGNEFTSGTLKSYRYTSEKVFEELTTKFKEDYKKTFSNLTDSELDKIIASRLKAYKGIDTTDAQVLITPSMYKQIAVRLGEWNNEKNASLNRILSNKELSSSELIEDLGVVMQPLKMVYYGISFRNGHAVPTYDKMSLAVLLPQMVKNTKLQKLYDYMTDEVSPVDMIKFDSAVKTGNTLTTDYIKEDSSISDSFASDIVTIKQPYKYLRRQQVTDPHHEDRRMVGTQVKKIILQNLRSNKVYNFNGKKINGNEVAEIVSNLYSGLSDKGRERIEKTLGVKDGNVNIDMLYKMLKKSAIASGMPYNVINSLLIDKSTGKPYANLDTMPDRRWAENRLSSKIGKATVDLMTSGDSFIQMSSYGMSNIASERVDDLKLFDSKGRTEIRVSVGLFKNVIPNYTELSWEDKKKWVKENFEGIGYRIPTQSQGSAIAFVVKEFLPEETGNVIQLPLEFTALTGSDFDIDKLFLMIKSYYTDLIGDVQEYSFVHSDNEEGTITKDSDLETIYKQIFASKIRAIEAVKEEFINAGIEVKYKTFINTIEEKLGINYAYEIDNLVDSEEPIKREDLEAKLDKLQKEIITLEEFQEENRGKSQYEVNHPKAMENSVIDIMKTVLTSEAHLVDTKTPIDAHTDNLKVILEELDGHRGTDNELNSFDWHSLSYQSRTKLFYIGGKFGIAPFALHNVHHALTQIANVGVKTQLNPFYNKKSEKESDKNNLARTYDKDNNLITDWFSGLINAHVDIANDPYIFRLNVTRDTYNQLSYLLRLGFGKNAFYFINQPSIVENPDSSLSTNKAREYYNRALALGKEEGLENDVVKKWKNQWSSAAFTLNQPDALLNQIKKDTKKDAKWYAIQSGILESYNLISMESSGLSELVQLTRIDGKNYGSTLGQIRLFDRRIQNAMLNDKFINAKELLNKTFLGSIKKNSVDFIQDIYSNVTISSTDGFVTMLDLLGEISTLSAAKGNKAKSYISDKLGNELFSSLASSYFSSGIGKGYESEDIADLIYGKNAVGRIMHSLRKNEEFKDNKLIEILKPIVDKKTGVWVIYTRSDVGNDTWTRNNLVTSWRELLTSKNPEIAEFAERLIDYSFYFSGFNKRLYSFFSHIPIDALLKKPTELNESISYDTFISQLKDNLTKSSMDLGDYYDVIRDIMVNNSDLVPEASAARVEQVGRGAMLFKVTHDMNLASSTEGAIIGSPFLKFFNNNQKQVIGEYVGYIDKGPEQGTKRFTFLYNVAEPKGFEKRGHKLVEYGNGHRTIVKENKELNIFPEENIEELITPNVEDFIYVKPEDRLVPYTELVKVRNTKLKERFKEFTEQIPEDSNVPAEKGYEDPNTIYADVPYEVMSELEDMTNIKKDDINNLETQEFENMILLNTIKSNHGEKQYELAKLALDNYNVSTEAKKVWDKLKECL